MHIFVKGKRVAIELRESTAKEHVRLRLASPDEPIDAPAAGVAPLAELSPDRRFISSLLDEFQQGRVPESIYPDIERE